jgi:GMP synthase (glutamine-hydrolysing)
VVGGGARLPHVRLPTSLVIQHSPGEPPGRLSEWLLEAGVLSDVAQPYAGTPLPADLDGYGALVVLGGAMSAYDDATAPWLGPTKDLLRAAVTAGVPTLAVCLGAQLLAVALGGRVARGEDGPEIGPALVAKRDVAAADPLFGPVPFTPDVVQWHYDGITALPAGAVLLASSPRYPTQAFRVGNTAWGLQFHIETTPEMVKSWADADAEQLAEQGIDMDRVLTRLEEAHADVAEVWQPFTRRFAELVRRTAYDQTP